MIFFGKKLEKEKQEAINMLKRISEEQKEEILEKKIKENIKRIIEKMHIEERFEIIFKRLDELAFKIEEIKNPNIKRDESLRKRKIKELIKMLLREHGRLTSHQLSTFLNLSRSRCSEYLNEMEKSGIVKGCINKRRKYYELLE